MFQQVGGTGHNKIGNDVGIIKIALKKKLILNLNIYIIIF